MRSLPGWCLWLLPKVSVPDRPCSPVRKVVDAQNVAFEKVDWGAADKRRIVLPALTLCCGACRPCLQTKAATRRMKSVIFWDQESFLIVFLLFVMTYGRIFIGEKVVRYSVRRIV